MSYNIEQKCFICEKHSKCVDIHFLESALNGIHCVGTEKGHLGSGTIKLECQTFVEKQDS